MSEDRREVNRLLRESQNRSTYFQLAAAGAAIGFSLNQTHAHTLVWSDIPLGIAVFCWGASFYAGCTYANYVSAILYDNVDFLDVRAGTHRAVGQSPQLIHIASEAVVTAMERKSSKANDLAKEQFTFLIGGGLFYIVWHIMQMWPVSA